jgi:hypothetical protein
VIKLPYLLLCLFSLELTGGELGVLTCEITGLNQLIALEVHFSKPLFEHPPCALLDRPLHSASVFVGKIAIECLIRMSLSWNYTNDIEFLGYTPA